MKRMSDMNQATKPYKPFAFFLIVFSLNWGPLWLLAIGLNRGWFATSLLPIAVGGISPTLAALVMIYASNNRKLRRDFWHRVLDPRLIPLRWLPIILLFVPLLMTVAVVISTGFEGLLSQLRPNPRFLAAPLGFFLLTLIYGPIPEELGWRGYGIDSLVSRMNGFWTTVLFGIIWPLWHLPLFFIDGTYQHVLLVQPIPLVFFLAGMLPQTVIMNWIFFHTNRSVISAILFHFTINFMGEALAIGQQTKVIAGILFFAAAICVVVADRKLFFQSPVVENPAFGLKGFPADHRSS